MIVFSLGPVFGIGLVGVLLVALVLVLIVADRKPNLPAPHDPDREIRRLTLKVRHPWKARASRFLGVE